jgi:hypothetical protein
MLRTLISTNEKVTMSFKVIALTLALVATHAGSMGQNLEKNELPCVAEICIGDGLAELAKVQWAPAQASYKVNNKALLTAEHKLSDDDMRMLKATYPNPGAAAPFLNDKLFDASALPALALVTAACQTNELTGSYGGDGSTPTRVGISLMPSLANPATQSWTVTTIVRDFPSAVSNEERAEMTRQLTRRYAKFGASARTVPFKAGDGRFFPSGAARFGFGLSLFRGTDEGSRMMAHPACAGMVKAKPN